MINPVLLDTSAHFLRGFPEGSPTASTTSFDAIAWMGQHAMSRTEYAHLAHTGSMVKYEYTINGKPVGEFGQLAQFSIIPLKPPFEMVKIFRATKEMPMTSLKGSHQTSIIWLLKLTQILGGIYGY